MERSTRDADLLRQPRRETVSFEQNGNAQQRSTVRRHTQNVS